MFDEMSQFIRSTKPNSAYREIFKLQKMLDESGIVSIMIEQMRYMLTPRLTQELDSYITKKLDRQLERIERAKEQEKEQYKQWRKGVQA